LNRYFLQDPSAVQQAPALSAQAPALSAQAFALSAQASALSAQASAFIAQVPPSFLQDPSLVQHAAASFTAHSFSAPQLPSGALDIANDPAAMAITAVNAINFFI
jgi:hypothetical protein